MNLSKLMIEKVKKRAIDDIALLTFNNLRIYDKKQAIQWYNDFFKLDSLDLETLINEVYLQQGESISKATENLIDFIKIPALGSIRLSRCRLDILNLAKEKGKEITSEDVEVIKRHYYEQVITMSKEPIVNISININEKKT